jgi:hypothetical protein
MTMKVNTLLSTNIGDAVSKGIETYFEVSLLRLINPQGYKV